jgi:hypothetical protein
MLAARHLKSDLDGIMRSVAPCAPYQIKQMFLTVSCISSRYSISRMHGGDDHDAKATEHNPSHWPAPFTMHHVEGSKPPIEVQAFHRIQK